MQVTIVLAILFSTVSAIIIDASTNSTQLWNACSTQYTHIVIGGGTSGLALASKLSQKYGKKVLVLEAGDEASTNPQVSIPGFAGSTFGSSLDWGYSTAPQTGAAGQSVSWPRGKGLGGSSLINFLAWTRGQRTEIDAWNSLNGFGWDWNNLLPYHKAAEKWFTPSPVPVTVVAQASVHGTNGPVKASNPPYVPPQMQAFYSAIQVPPFNIPIAADMSCGASAGVTWAPSSVNPSGQVRSESNTAYAAPLISSTSLVIIKNARVTKVNFSPVLVGSDRVATGAAFKNNAGLNFNTFGNKVILSSGTVNTPQLLELSGIGNSGIVTSKGIPSLVNLPGVGENLQDHPATVNVYKLRENTTSLDMLSFDPTFYSNSLSAYSSGQGILTNALSALAFLRAKHFLSTSDFNQALSLMNSNVNIFGSNIAQQLIKQTSLFSQNGIAAELVPVNVYFGQATGSANTRYLSIASCLMQSQSRGSIHINSADPLVSPTIDPRYLSHPADPFLLKRSAQFVRNLVGSPLLAPFIDSETEPGLSVSSESQWDQWIKQSVRTEYHPVGTASMMPRDKNGVVDRYLKVYGTTNLHVVDLSIVPVHVSSHPQSLAYAIAEKASTFL